jgi:hypothetical protein
MEEREMKWSGWEYRQVEGSCEHDYRHLDSMTCREFLNYLRNTHFWRRINFLFCFIVLSCSEKTSSRRRSCVEYVYTVCFSSKVKYRIVPEPSKAPHQEGIEVYGDRAPRNLSHGTRCRSVVSCKFRLPYRRRQVVDILRIQRWVCLDFWKEKKNLVPEPPSDPRFLDLPSCSLITIAIMMFQHLYFSMKFKFPLSLLYQFYPIHILELWKPTNC